MHLNFVKDSEGCILVEGDILSRKGLDGELAEVIEELFQLEIILARDNLEDLMQGLGSTALGRRQETSDLSSQVFRAGVDHCIVGELQILAVIQTKRGIDVSFNLNTRDGEAVDPVIHDRVINSSGRLNHVYISIAKLDDEYALNSIGFQEGVQGSQHSDGFLGSRFMFLTEERTIDALESCPAMALNVGELAEALDFIATELSIAVGGSGREPFSAGSIASPCSNGVNPSYTWGWRNNGSPLGIDLVEESHESLDLINGGKPIVVTMMVGLLCGGIRSWGFRVVWSLAA